MNTCSRISFFNDEFAIATGYIGPQRKNFFHTRDGGRTWTQRQFATVAGGAWIYDVFTTPQGHAWMGGSSGTLFYSGDFGENWSVLAQPFDNVTRLHRVFIASDERHGIIGALHNALKLTDDGGRTWSSIPTPLDQRASTRAVASEFGSNEIQAVAIWSDQLLAQQNEHVYASPLSPVQWRELPLAAFALDPQARALYGIDHTDHFVRVDAALNVTRIAGATMANDRRELSYGMDDLLVIGEVSYALDSQGGLYRADAHQVSFTTAMIDADPTSAFASVRRMGEALWASTPHGLYRSNDAGDSWQLAFANTVPPLVGLEPRTASEIAVWSPSGAVQLVSIDDRQLHAIDALANRSTVTLVVRGDAWILLAYTPTDAEVWRSNDRARTWTRVDHWQGDAPRDAAFLPDGSVVVSDAHGALHHNGRVGRTLDREMPCCTSLYFADANEGFMRGYVHHMGDMTWRTHDAGATWTPVIDSAQFPYAQVVPYRDGALAIVGDSFRYEDNRRQVYFLRGLTRQLVYNSPEHVSDLSVDPDGNILIELDSDPESFEDPTGKTWLSLQP